MVSLSKAWDNIFKLFFVNKKRLLGNQQYRNEG